MFRRFIILFFPLLLVAFVGLSVHAQGGLARVELPAEQETDVFSLIPCEDFGSLVLYETHDILDAESRRWEFMFYDTNLYEIWVQEVPVVLGAGLNAYEIRDDVLYLFFLNGDRVKSIDDNFQIITMQLGTNEMTISRGQMAEKSMIADFKLIGDVAVVGLNSDDHNAFVYFVHLNTGEVFKSIFNLHEQNVLQSIAPDPATGRVDVVVSNYINKKQNALLLFNVDTKGNILNTIQVNPVEEGKFLNTARVARVDDQHKLLLGSYNSLQGKLPDDDSFREETSAGFFAVKMEDGQQVSIQYYNFLELMNIRAGISGKDFYKMQKRMHREGSEYSMNYALLYHDIVKRNDQFLLLTESYFPDYKTVSDISYDYWGRPVPQSYTVFDGFKYINGILASFDADGNLLWDNSLEIYNIITYQLAPRVNLLLDDDMIILYYNEGGKITYKAIDRGEAVTDLIHTELRPMKTGDRIYESGYDNMTHWYDNYYLCYGYQKIRNETARDPKRTIFYFSKVLFE